MTRRRDGASLRIAVLGDTHIPRRGRDLPPQAWSVVRGCDVAIHTGDVVERPFLDRLGAALPVLAVRGNNDAALPDLPESITTDLGGVRVGIVHDAGPAAGRRARLRRLMPDVRVAVFGHSHIPLVDDDGDLLLLNPGSPTDRRRQPAFTMAVLEVSRGRPAAWVVDLGLARA